MRGTKNLEMMPPLLIVGCGGGGGGGGKGILWFRLWVCDSHSCATRRRRDSFFVVGLGSCFKN